MADLSELNTTLKSLNSNITRNNALLSRQYATKTVSDRLEQSRKLEEQREAERRKRLEGSGSGAGGTGDGSGIPGGSRGFFSRLFSGKIGLALLGIGGFAALASRMGGSGNALRKLLDSTIGVLLKIVQEVAAMTADFIGATEVGKAIRNFDLQKYINKSLNWLYDPKKEGAEAWFGGIPAQLSKMFNKFFTEDRKKELSDTFDKIFKFIYNKNGEGEFIDKVFGGILRPIEDARVALVDAYTGTSGTGIEKFFRFFYDPSTGKIFGGLLDEVFNNLKGFSIETGGSIAVTINEGIKKLTLFITDLLFNAFDQIPKMMYMSGNSVTRFIMRNTGLAPENYKDLDQIRKLKEKEEEFEGMLDKGLGLSQDIAAARGDEAALRAIKDNKQNQLLFKQLFGGSFPRDPNKLSDIDFQSRLNEIAEKKNQFSRDRYALEDKDALSRAERKSSMLESITGSFDQRTENIKQNTQRKFEAFKNSNEENVAAYLSFNLFGNNPLTSPKTILASNKLLTKTLRRGKSIPGFSELNPSARAGILQYLMYMSDSEYNEFKNSEILKTAIQNKDYNTLSSLVPENVPISSDPMGGANIRDLVSGNTRIPNFQRSENTGGISIVQDNSIKRAGDVVTVSGGGASNSSDSAKNSTNYGYALMN